MFNEGVKNAYSKYSAEQAKNVLMTQVIEPQWEDRYLLSPAKIKAFFQAQQNLQKKKGITMQNHPTNTITDTSLTTDERVVHKESNVNAIDAHSSIP
jgi:hypothetical protein